MKIEWGTVLAILIALVAFKLIDKFALSKVTEKLEETFNS